MLLKGEGVRFYLGWSSVKYLSSPPGETFGDWHLAKLHRTIGTYMRLAYLPMQFRNG